MASYGKVGRCSASAQWLSGPFHSISTSISGHSHNFLLALPTHLGSNSFTHLDTPNAPDSSLPNVKQSPWTLFMFRNNTHTHGRTVFSSWYPTRLPQPFKSTHLPVYVPLEGRINIRIIRTWNWVVWDHIFQHHVQVISLGCSLRIPHCQMFTAQGWTGDGEWTPIFDGLNPLKNPYFQVQF